MPAEVVFKDTSSIVGGDDWPTEIEAALNAAHIVVVVIGPDWLKASDEYGRRRLDTTADWVRRELDTALIADKKILPVLVRGAPFPPEPGLPLSLRSLPGKQPV